MSSFLHLFFHDVSYFYHKVHLTIFSRCGRWNNIKYITVIDDEFINRDFLTQNGKESLAIISLLSRNISLRYKIDEYGVRWHEVIFNMKYLYSSLGIRLNRKAQKDSIANTLNNLIEYGVFSGDLDLEQVDVNDIIRLDYQLVNKGFTVISDYEFDRIFKYDAQRIDKYNLFNIYLTIKKYANNENRMSYPSIELLMHICDIGSNNTVLKYISTLTEIGLISCMRGELYTNEYGKIRRGNNTYKILQ